MTNRINSNAITLEEILVPLDEPKDDDSPRRGLELRFPKDITNQEIVTALKAIAGINPAFEEALELDLVGHDADQFVAYGE